MQLFLNLFKIASMFGFTFIRLIFCFVFLQHGFIGGVMQLLLLNLSAHLTKELGMAPGGEFRKAFQEVCCFYGDISVS